MAKRRFSAKEGTISKQLVSVMTKMGATNLRVDKQLIGEPTVNITFDRSGKRYKFTSDRFDNQLDNYRAAQLTIEYLYRALEAYGVSKEETIADSVFDRFMLGFQATPDDNVLKIGNATKWYEILGVPENAPLEDIKNAYRSLSRVHHPDVGGDTENFKRINKAYEEGVSLR